MLVFILLAIVLTFGIPKVFSFSNSANLDKLKSEYYLIKTSILKYKSKNVLLNKSSDLISLDSATINKKDEKLFDKIIDFEILSTDKNSQKMGSWIKNSESSYSFIIDLNKKVDFALENSVFRCKSAFNVCKDLD